METIEQKIETNNQKEITNDLVVDLYLKYFGYDLASKDFVIDREILKLLLQKTSFKNDVSFKKLKSNKFKVIDYTKNFFVKNFRLHNVTYIEKDRLEQFNNDYCNFKMSFLQFKDLIMKNINLVSPFDLSIEYIEGNSMVGEIAKHTLLVDDDNFLKSIPILFDSIKLGNEITELTSATYGHEITHSQIESIKGGTKYFYHREVIPILIEKIMAYDLSKKTKKKEILELSERKRIQHLNVLISSKLISNSNTIEDLKGTSYIVGTVIAQGLFEKFNRGNNDFKKEMLKNIQKIFDAELTVEEFIKIYNSNFNESLPIILNKKY